MDVLHLKAFPIAEKIPIENVFFLNKKFQNKNNLWMLWFFCFSCLLLFAKDFKTAGLSLYFNKRLKEENHNNKEIGTNNNNAT